MLVITINKVDYSKTYVLHAHDYTYSPPAPYSLKIYSLTSPSATLPRRRSGTTLCTQPRLRTKRSACIAETTTLLRKFQTSNIIQLTLLLVRTRYCIIICVIKVHITHHAQHHMSNKILTTALKNCLIVFIINSSHSSICSLSDSSIFSST